MDSDVQPALSIKIGAIVEPSTIEDTRTRAMDDAFFVRTRVVGILGMTKMSRTLSRGLVL